MTEQPRDQYGRFVNLKVVESSDYKVTFRISEYECRVIGNRLHRAYKRYDKLHDDVNCQIDQDCNYWASIFLSKVSSRDRDEDYYDEGKKRHVDSNYHVEVQLTDYECWSLGNRLFEVGKFFDQKGYTRVADETKWLARRFHAERKQASEEESEDNENAE